MAKKTRFEEQFPELAKKAHKERHVTLHKALDELLADWMACTRQTVTDKTVGDLMKWSYEQTQNPTEPK